MPKQPVLLILHQEHSSPGRVGQTLAKLGYPLDIRRPRFGDPLPETMDDHAGAVIFGDPERVTETIDIWTFGRPLRAHRDAWKIYQTREDAADQLSGSTVPQSK